MNEQALKNNPTKDIHTFTLSFAIYSPFTMSISFFSFLFLLSWSILCFFYLILFFCQSCFLVCFVNPYYHLYLPLFTISLFSLITLLLFSHLSSLSPFVLFVDYFVLFFFQSSFYSFSCLSMLLTKTILANRRRLQTKLKKNRASLLHLVVCQRINQYSNGDRTGKKSFLLLRVDEIRFPLIWFTIWRNIIFYF